MHSSRVIGKVTAFITRESVGGYDLLLFEHPNAGIQVPAGTMEAGETPEEAVLREAREETGLSSFSVRCHLGCAETRLLEGQRAIVEPTTVYARPDTKSFDWARFRKGILVTLTGRQADGFTQVTFEEFDRDPDPQYVTMCITGWVPDAVLTNTVKRHFFLLEFHGHSEERWEVHSDCHLFSPFWAPLTNLPEIIHPQNKWLKFLHKEFPALGKGSIQWTNH